MNRAISMDVFIRDSPWSEEIRAAQIGAEEEQQHCIGFLFPGLFNLQGRQVRPEITRRVLFPSFPSVCPENKTFY